MDSRAYRLEWPTGSIVFEIDQPEVIESKDSILTGLAATPATRLWASTCAKSGQRHCDKQVLIARNPAPGWPRG